MGEAGELGGLTGGLLHTPKSPLASSSSPVGPWGGGGGGSCCSCFSTPFSDTASEDVGAGGGGDCGDDGDTTGDDDDDDDDDSVTHGTLRPVSCSCFSCCFMLITESLAGLLVLMSLSMPAPTPGAAPPPVCPGSLAACMRTGAWVGVGKRAWIWVGVGKRAWI